MKKFPAYSKNQIILGIIAFGIFLIGVISFSGGQFLTLVSQSIKTPKNPPATYHTNILPQTKVLSDLEIQKNGRVRDAKKIAAPDLIAQRIKISPKSLLAGRQLSIEGLVKNTGSVIPAGVLSRARIDIGDNGSWDVILPDKVLSDFRGRQTKIQRWLNAWLIKAGTHRLEYCVDIKNFVREISEANNCITITITTQKK